jgi:hypothetical protein
MMNGSLCTLFLEITAHGLDIAHSGGLLMLRGKNPAILKVGGWHGGAAPTEHEFLSTGAQPLQNMNFLARGRSPYRT